MAKLLKYILFLCILNSILFYNKTLGINVILFMVPLLIFILSILEDNNKINNKYGIFFIIPIILLSCTYFIYNNQFFKVLNTIVIFMLYIFMYIYIVKPTYKINEVLNDVIAFLYKPFSCIGNLYRILNFKISSLLKIKDDNKKKIKSIIIVIPIVIIVLMLLGSADMIFNNIFINCSKIFKNIDIINIFGRIIIIIILFTYIGVFINYLIFDYKDKKYINNNKFKIENYTIKLLLTILNIVYIIFDFIQIRSLIFHQISESINYSQYAREGFFQLMFISILNLIIILISKHSNDKDNKYNKSMSILMIILTLIIIVSSFLRMNMYENAYGYTLLRLLVYITLITEVILLVPTTIYIINSKTKILKYYIIIIISVYTIINLVPIDYLIAYRNINRYYDTNKIDLNYLKNNYTDNIPLLIELYNKTDDKILKKEINYYLIKIYNNKSCDLLEYNFSKIDAKNQIEKNGLNIVIDE